MIKWERQDLKVFGDCFGPKEWNHWDSPTVLGIKLDTDRDEKQNKFQRMKRKLPKFLEGK